MRLLRKLYSWRASGSPSHESTEGREIAAGLPLLVGLIPGDLDRLLDLADRFLRRKTLEPVGNLMLDNRDRYTIALQACLPILELGLNWYQGWSAVVIYPDEFVPTIEEIDEAGVVHQWHAPRSGESWSHGPVILSFSAVQASGHCDGYNVVIHEVSHKLDMLNGDANGYPPLHRGMSSAHWSRAFEQAFMDMTQRVQAGATAPIDPYATDSPGECFAVFSEYFFECPRLLQAEYPAVYQQLALFYRQDPAQRLRS